MRHETDKARGLLYLFLRFPHRIHRLRVFPTEFRLLRQNSRNPSQAQRHQQGALLQGLLHCVACGCVMTPTFATKNGVVRYRYYVCCNAQKHMRTPERDALLGTMSDSHAAPPAHPLPRCCAANEPE